MSENEKDHERIWLEPMVLDGGYGPEGRCWSHDNPWPEDQGDMPATEYVRADLLTAAEARIKMLSEALAGVMPLTSYGPEGKSPPDELAAIAAGYAALAAIRKGSGE